jgi:hypothetical protein
LNNIDSNDTNNAEQQQDSNLIETKNSCDIMNTKKINQMCELRAKKKEQSTSMEDTELI